MTTFFNDQSTVTLQKAFVESLLDLFEQETEDMIDAIEESRMELRGTMLDFEDETEQLRAESRMLGTSTGPAISSS